MSHFPCMSTDRSAEDRVLWPMWNEFLCPMEGNSPSLGQLCCILPVGEWSGRDKRLELNICCPRILGAAAYVTSFLGVMVTSLVSN